MTLHKFVTLGQLNDALLNYDNLGIRVAKVKLLTVNDQIQYFVLTDEKNTYQSDEAKANVE